MNDVEHDLHILVSIAKIDARINECRTELALLPDKVEKLSKKIESIVQSEKESAAHQEELAKERRLLEQKVQDNEEKIKKYRVQLMEVKSNKEYTAMLHEIEHLEKDTDGKEERLLMLMDELDQQATHHDEFMEGSTRSKKALDEEKALLEERLRLLKEETARLEADKPAWLKDLDPKLRRLYDRILAKLGDFAVTNVTDDTCQGCFTRIPPQTAVEVRRNEKIITCEACGRILVHYVS